MGTIRIDLRDIITNDYKDPQYFHIYGPSTYDGDNTEGKVMMTLYPDTASYWNGAVFMSIECKKSKGELYLGSTPIQKQEREIRKRSTFENIRSDSLIDGLMENKIIDYKLYANIHYAIAIKPGQKYCVRLRWGPFWSTSATTLKKDKNEIVEWDQRLYIIVEDKFNDQLETVSRILVFILFQ